MSQPHLCCTPDDQVVCKPLDVLGDDDIAQLLALHRHVVHRQVVHQEAHLQARKEGLGQTQQQEQHTEHAHTAHTGVCMFKGMSFKALSSRQTWHQTCTHMLGTAVHSWSKLQQQECACHTTAQHCAPVVPLISSHQTSHSPCLSGCRWGPGPRCAYAPPHPASRC